MIARKVPLSSSLWSGTTTCAKGSSRRRMMWLPSCRLKWNPILSKALAQSRPEILGNLLIPLPEALRNALRELEDDPLPEPEYTLGLLL